MGTRTSVRAIHQGGVLKLLDPLELPEGAQVSVVVTVPSDQGNNSHVVELVHPTRVVPAEKLDSLLGLVAIGGDALADRPDPAHRLANQTA